MGFYFNQGDRPLSGYTIQRGVGRGGFGEVYYATSDGGKDVALKYLRENPQVELRGVQHCLNLKSPHLVAIHDIKENEAGDSFVIMEYVSGPSLRDLLNSEPGGLGVAKAAFFLREIGKGLAYLHDRGIVHRDLKPGNIFYEDGYVKIGDYGLAKLMASSQHSGQTVSVGTVHYMAPEVGSGNYDRTIDIYALGVMLYEMLLGKVPFSGATMGEVLMKHLTAQPQVDELPSPFPQVIRKALAKDPKDRYQTVQEMIADIFDVADVERSVASFEPASLTTLAAHAAAKVQPAPRGGVALVGEGSSNVGRYESPPTIPGAAAARVEPMRGRGRASQGGDSEPFEHQSPGSLRALRASKIIAAVGIAIGGALLFSLEYRGFSRQPLLAVAGFLSIAMLVQGVVIGCYLCFEKLKLRADWMPRIVIATLSSLGLLFIWVMFGNLLSGDAQNWPLVLMAVALLCDWPERFHAGRQGDVSFSSALNVAIFAFVASIFIADRSFPLAGLAGAASLALQSVAGVWPAAPRLKVAPRGMSAEPSAILDSPNAVRVTPGASSERVGDRERFSPPPNPSPIQTPGPSPAPQDAVTTRFARSETVRKLWWVAAAFMLAACAILGSAVGLAGFDAFGEAVCVAGTIVCGNAALFCIACAVPRYHKGLWRGIFRKAVFFTGMATAGAAGSTIGMLNLRDTQLWVAASISIFGALTSLLVWVIPTRPYVPFHQMTEESQLAARRRRGGWMLGLGIGLFCWLAVVMAVLAETVPPPNDAIINLAVALPMLTASILLMVFGGRSLSRAGRKQKKADKKAARQPLRTVFEIDAIPDLSKILQRHLSAMGYELDELKAYEMEHHADRYWSFERGNWTAQFWQEDVRRWGVRLNVAAHEVRAGVLRLTCVLDLAQAYCRPNRKQWEQLRGELDDLRIVLNGRELSSSV